ncbi:hypothetical protein PR048_003155 [Dryococelus australis]|uniref:Uncharacterized protein n=1 Tax=Dryococelus australis TaxID=614101 RepID=A0ABQ9INR5_9NEOP|nr:hypothetical protein PR048_003155 [Dryococelus australis]
MGRCGAVVRQLVSHLGELGSTFDGVAPGIPHVGIVPDDATVRWIFSGISRSPRPCILALLHTRLDSPSSTLKTSMLRAAQISPFLSTPLPHLCDQDVVWGSDQPSGSQPYIIPYSYGHIASVATESQWLERSQEGLQRFKFNVNELGLLRLVILEDCLVVGSDLINEASVPDPLRQGWSFTRASICCSFCLKRCRRLLFVLLIGWTRSRFGFLDRIFHFGFGMVTSFNFSALLLPDLPVKQQCLMENTRYLQAAETPLRRSSHNLSVTDAKIYRGRSGDISVPFAGRLGGASPHRWHLTHPSGITVLDSGPGLSCRPDAINFPGDAFGAHARQVAATNLLGFAIAKHSAARRPKYLAHLPPPHTHTPLVARKKGEVGGGRRSLHVRSAEGSPSRLSAGWIVVWQRLVPAHAQRPAFSRRSATEDLTAGLIASGRAPWEHFTVCARRQSPAPAMPVSSRPGTSCEPLLYSPRASSLSADRLFFSLTLHSSTAIQASFTLPRKVVSYSAPTETAPRRVSFRPPTVSPPPPEQTRERDSHESARATRRRRASTQLTSLSAEWSCSGVAVRLLASHIDEPDSIPGGVAPGFSHVGIVPDNATGRQVSCSSSRFSRLWIPALLHTYLISPPSGLNNSMLISKVLTLSWTTFIERSFRIQRTACCCVLVDASVDNLQIRRAETSPKTYLTRKTLKTPALDVYRKAVGSESIVIEALSAYLSPRQEPTHYLPRSSLEHLRTAKNVDGISPCNITCSTHAFEGLYDSEGKRGRGGYDPTSGRAATGAAHSVSGTRGHSRIAEAAEAQRATTQQCELEVHEHLQLPPYANVTSSFGRADVCKYGVTPSHTAPRVYTKERPRHMLLLLLRLTLVWAPRQTVGLPSRRVWQAGYSHTGAPTPLRMLPGFPSTCGGNLPTHAYSDSVSTFHQLRFLFQHKIDTTSSYPVVLFTECVNLDLPIRTCPEAVGSFVQPANANAVLSVGEPYKTGRKRRESALCFRRLSAACYSRNKVSLTRWTGDYGSDTTTQTRVSASTIFTAWSLTAAGNKTEEVLQRQETRQRRSYSGRKQDRGGLTAAGNKTEEVLQRQETRQRRSYSGRKQDRGGLTAAGNKTEEVLQRQETRQRRSSGLRL